jgi:SAM-dependent methyltransferase
VSAPSPYAERAASLYDRAGATRYRAHDDEFEASAACRDLGEWLSGACALFTPPIDALDLGCGTGRYFWAVRGVGSLIGLDASPAMLEEARRPYHADRIGTSSVSLIRGDLLTHSFEAARFDLVYSIGVLAEHVPLTDALVARVAEWLRPGGRFAFTTVHPASPSIPRTPGRRIGMWIEPVTFGAARRRLRDRLLQGGLYADAQRVRELLAPEFVVESLDPFQSESHLHCRCVARRLSAEDGA